MPPPLPYWPALDGLRALAVLAVMLFHAHPPALPGGFLGVDIFFVISGFLITAQLLVLQSQPGGLRYGAFLLKRAARLQPALWAMLLACMGLWQLGLMPLTPAEPLTEFLVVVLGLGNWARSFSLLPLDMWGHTWSLGIEEQFYLLWPLLLWGMHRASWRLTTQALVVVSLALLSAVLMGLMHQLGSSVARLYNGTDTRVHALLLGSVLALWRHQAVRGVAPSLLHPASRVAPDAAWRSTLAGGLAAAGLVAMLVTAQWKAPAMYLGGYLLTGLLATLLVARLTGLAPGWLMRVLGGRVMVHIGTLSYGLYLWHYPLYRWADHLAVAWGHPQARLVCLLIATVASFLLAAASLRWIEQPLRQRVRQRLHRPAAGRAPA